MLEIKQLSASVEGNEILHRLSLSVSAGEMAAIMGPNGSGKSTLAAVIAGHPAYEVSSGSVKFSGEEVLGLNPEERARLGIFLAFQYPPSLPGVSVSHFLKSCLNAQEKARSEAITPTAAFIKQLRQYMRDLQIPLTFAERSLNDGFSGGEKKRIEMLQMLVLQPRLVILDEIDSGLDIDAIKVVADAVHQLDRSKTTIVVITHYQRLLNYIIPDTVHVMKTGELVKSGSSELALELEQSGYVSL